jgi:TRAP-type C4-dicarboxylate transport system permease small subunit
MGAIAAICRFGMILTSVLLAAITIGVLYDVFMRYFLKAPTLWSVEYTGYALAWMALLATGEILRKGEHIRIQLLTHKLSPAGQALAARFSALFVFLVSIVLAVASIAWAWDAFSRGEVSDTVLQTPQVYVRLAFPFGMICMALASLPSIFAPPGGGNADSGDEWKLHS